MKKLIIAEKPSVAKELSKTLKGCTKTKEYYENEEYIITSLYGHLLELYQMEDYNKELKIWNIEDLPYFPNGFRWKIKKQKGIKERYKLIEKLILKKEVDIIINCGDNDREGEVLVNNLIYDIFRKNKIQKTVKRILLPDLAESTVRTELNNLRNIKDTENWYKEGLARTYIDWIYGINFSRFVSIKAKDKFPVGRVIVPTVKFIYDREQEITNFKEEKYIQLEGIITKDNKEIKIELGDKVKLEKGEEVDIKLKVVEKTTNPPNRVTEAELNNFYENPFKKEKKENEDETTDEDYIAIMEGCEIGTAATRAGIIEKVKQDGYIVENKNNLAITDKGIKLIEILEELGINLYKEKTVEISKDLKAIYNNKSSVDKVLEKVKEEVKQGINKKAEITQFKKAAIGKCPICGKDIIENNKSYYCEDWQNCGFSIWKQICGKKINDTIIRELLEKGKTKEIKGFKSKQGKTFSASLVIEENKVKLNYGNSKGAKR